MPNPRRFYRAAAFDHGEPLSRPRYDVVAAAIAVCLLACLLGSSKWVKDHVIYIDLPQPIDLPPEPLIVLSISPAGSIYWNNEIVSDDGLRRALLTGLYEPVEPLIRFEPNANASYGRVVGVIDIIKRTGVTKFCFGNLNEFRVFHKHPQPLFLTILPPEDWDGPRAIPPHLAGTGASTAEAGNECDRPPEPGLLGF